MNDQKTMSMKGKKQEKENLEGEEVKKNKLQYPEASALEELLIKENYIKEEDMKKARKRAKNGKETALDCLMMDNILTKELIGQAIAESFGIFYANLTAYRPTHEQILKIPQDTALKYHVIFFKEDEKSITIATDNPQEKNLETILSELFPSKKIIISFALKEDIEELFVHYRQSLETRFSEIIAKQKKIAPDLIDEIIKDALTNKTSDIHFEPQKENVVIRFRIDGVLHNAGVIPKQYYENILNRVKVQSQIRIDEHASAQDGAIRMEINNMPLDIRVSIIPTVNGEKITMRLLKSYIQGLALSDIGLSHQDQEILSRASRKPFGMILVTGPTGAGKTTTLYSVLRLLNTPDVNITTIEDPVEYKVEGINQIKVNTETNLTFANGLRSIVRQDPDIILVGEIRDHETAEIAINASLTGHLLLSTFHANDAPTTIPRMIDMGIEPFLIASTLELIIAQRLVRKICPACRHSITCKKEDLKNKFPGASEYFKEENMTLYEGKGCSSCNNSGYKGRIAIFEFLENTKELQDLIVQNPSKKQIWNLARKNGARSLFEDGMEKVKSGITTLEEVIRIIPPTED